MKNNWLKMYDKFGLLLRVETVINQPENSKSCGTSASERFYVGGWFAMCKGVGNLHTIKAMP